MYAYANIVSLGVVICIFSCLISSAVCTFTAEEKKFQRDAVRTHNVFRAIHSAPALKLDFKLTKLAKSLADEAAKSNGFQKISTGENVYESTSTHYRDISGKEVTEAW